MNRRLDSRALHNIPAPALLGLVRRFNLLVVDKPGSLVSRERRTESLNTQRIPR
jgi:hypothetical protein